MFTIGAVEQIAYKYIIVTLNIDRSVHVHISVFAEPLKLVYPIEFRNVYYIEISTIPFHPRVTPIQ